MKECTPHPSVWNPEDMLEHEHCSYVGGYGACTHLVVLCGFRLGLKVASLHGEPEFCGWDEQGRPQSRGQHTTSGSVSKGDCRGACKQHNNCICNPPSNHMHIHRYMYFNSWRPHSVKFLRTFNFANYTLQLYRKKETKEIKQKPHYSHNQCLALPYAKTQIMCTHTYISWTLKQHNMDHQLLLNASWCKKYSAHYSHNA